MFACVVWLVGVSAHADDARLRVAVLGSLDKECSLERRWIGIVPRLPYGLWLRCRDAEFLVTEPMSLYGHVRLRTPSDALEFVRFFTLPTSDAYTRPDGMVEVMPATEGADEFNIVRPEVFRRRFHPAIVKALPKNANEKAETFSIRRVMLTRQGSVVELTELVNADGYYDVLSQHMLVSDASKLGLYYEH
jgi:hypothetical protein